MNISEWLFGKKNDKDTLQYMFTGFGDLAIRLSSIDASLDSTKTIEKLENICNEEFGSDSITYLAPEMVRSHFKDREDVYEFLRNHNYFQDSDEDKIYVPFKNNGERNLGLLCIENPTHNFSSQDNQLKDPVLDFLGSQGGLLIAKNNIIERDDLTGVLKKEKILQIYNDLTNRREEYCVIFLDIDHFGWYNNTFGHQQGDLALSAFAQVLKDSLPRSSDVIGRYGGEEFMVILPKTKIEFAEKIAERIRQNVAEVKVDIAESTKIGNNSDKYHLTDKNNQPDPSRLQCSVGVAYSLTEYQLNPNNPNPLHSADQCTYRSKRAGRNRVSSTSMRAIKQ
jgi:diguanylate cyclase (GGDEF)-like protein